MKPTTRNQLIIVIAGVVLTIAIYLAPKTQKVETAPAPVATAAMSFEEQQASALSALSEEDSRTIAALMARLKDQPGSAEILKAMAEKWSEVGNAAISAHYYEKLSETDTSTGISKLTGDKYFEAFKVSKDSVTRIALASKAIEAYEKVKDDATVGQEVSINMAVAYVDGTGEPMKGIMMLRKITEEDPRNEEAQLNLGYFSYRSAQYEKAIDRFKKVLEINPSRVDAYLFIGETYEAMGNAEEARKNYEVFVNLTADEKMKKEVQQYIIQLKTK